MTANLSAERTPHGRSMRLFLAAVIALTLFNTALVYLSIRPETNFGNNSNARQPFPLPSAIVSSQAAALVETKDDAVKPPRMPQEIEEAMRRLPEAQDVPPAIQNNGLDAAEAAVAQPDVTWFLEAEKTGHGNWTIEGNKVAVYSWSYGLPGMCVANCGDAPDCSLEARMRSLDPGPHGWQGLALCVSREVGEYQGSPSLVVRVYDGKVQLMDCVPNFKGNGGNILASVPLGTEKETDWNVGVKLKSSSSIVVTLEGKPVLSYALKKPMRGAWALVAANGSYLFENVHFTAKK